MKPLDPVVRVKLDLEIAKALDDAGCPDPETRVLEGARAVLKDAVARGLTIDRVISIVTKLAIFGR